MSFTLIFGLSVNWSQPIIIILPNYLERVKTWLLFPSKPE